MAEMIHPPRSMSRGALRAEPATVGAARNYGSPVTKYIRYIIWRPTARLPQEDWPESGPDSW